MSELEEYIKECDCEIIRNRANISFNQTLVPSGDKLKPRVVYFPSIDQLLEMLGDSFLRLERCDCGAFITWNCFCISSKREAEQGQSARIALIKAVKGVKDE